MPLVKILNTVGFKVGKFGGTFVNIHKISIEQQSVSNFFLPPRPNQAVFGDILGMGMGTEVCESGFKQNPDYRPYWAIDTSSLQVPIDTCATPAGKQRFFDQFKDPIYRDDPFLNRDPDLDYIGGQNILNTRFGSRKYTASGSGDNIEVVSAISFSLTTTTNFEPSYDATIEVHWARGMDTSGGCPSQTIHKPVIVPDQRNEEGLNIARFGYKGQWWLSGSRYYLEIRHGLNTVDYNAIVNDGGWFVQIPKKNSLILARYIDQSTSALEKNAKYELDESMFELPYGRINVTIFADPCDITGQTNPG
jgi:hypothetical protein